MMGIATLVAGLAFVAEQTGRLRRSDAFLQFLYFEFHMLFVLTCYWCVTDGVPRSTSTRGTTSCF